MAQHATPLNLAGAILNTGDAFETRDGERATFLGVEPGEDGAPRWKFSAMIGTISVKFTTHGNGCFLNTTPHYLDIMRPASAPKAWDWVLKGVVLQAGQVWLTANREKVRFNGYSAQHKVHCWECVNGNTKFVSDPVHGESFAPPPWEAKSLRAAPWDVVEFLSRAPVTPPDTKTITFVKMEETGICMGVCDDAPGVTAIAENAHAPKTDPVTQRFYDDRKAAAANWAHGPAQQPASIAVPIKLRFVPPRVSDVLEADTARRIARIRADDALAALKAIPTALANHKADIAPLLAEIRAELEAVEKRVNTKPNAKRELIRKLSGE